MIKAKLIDRVMKRYNLQTTEGVLFMLCAYSGDAEHLSLMHTMLENLPAKVKVSSIQELIDKNILDGSKIKDINKANFMDLYPTKEFEERYFIDADIAGEELFKAYPTYTIIEGKTIPLKKGDKIGDTYFSKEDLMKFYAKKIGQDILLHEKILSLVARGNEAGIINSTIRSFIWDKGWEELEVMLDSMQTQYENKTII